MLYKAICECGGEEFVLMREPEGADDKIRIKCSSCGKEFASVAWYSLNMPESGEQHEEDKDSD